MFSSFSGSNISPVSPSPSVLLSLSSLTQNSLYLIRIIMSLEPVLSPLYYSYFQFFLFQVSNLHDTYLRFCGVESPGVAIIEEVAFAAGLPVADEVAIVVAVGW